MFHRWKSKAPTVGVAAAFGLTAAAARAFSMILPRVHWEPVPGVHVHHYVYGIFILAIAGYLALIFRGNRATTWIALLYGLGIGLTFDEFGMWLNPPFVRGVRWNTNGLTIVFFALAFAGLLPVLLRRKPLVNREIEQTKLIPRSRPNPSTVYMDGRLHPKDIDSIPKASLATTTRRIRTTVKSFRKGSDGRQSN